MDADRRKPISMSKSVTADPIPSILTSELEKLLAGAILRTFPLVLPATLAVVSVVAPDVV
jgi:hypothetical protein